MAETKPVLTMSLHLHRNGGSRFSELQYRIHKDGKPTGVFHVRKTDGSPHYYITSDELRFRKEVLDLMVPENRLRVEAWILERADLPEPPPSPEEAERLAVLAQAREDARKRRESGDGTEPAPHPAHHYEIQREAKSELIKGSRFRLPSGYGCPRCSRIVGVIEHGQTVECPGCGLSITRWGNGLELSAEV